jgi:glycerophosphoryl diester phosphodiesterase
MELVAHRGFAEAYPENTEYAFTRAAGSADWIELDVRRCESGELVVFHDETVDRMTDGTGRLGNHTLSELRELSVGACAGSVPTLDEALTAVPADVGVEVELKQWGTAAETLEQLAEVDNPTSVISFGPLALHAVAQHDPHVNLGLVLYDGIYGDAPKLGLDTAAHLGCTTVHLFASMVVESVVTAAHERDLLVQAATPDEGPTPAVLERYRSIGVDRLSADRPPQ